MSSRWNVPERRRWSHTENVLRGARSRPWGRLHPPARTRARRAGPHARPCTIGPGASRRRWERIERTPKGPDRPCRARGARGGRPRGRWLRAHPGDGTAADGRSVSRGAAEAGGTRGRTPRSLPGPSRPPRRDLLRRRRSDRGGKIEPEVRREPLSGGLICREVIEPHRRPGHWSWALWDTLSTRLRGKETLNH